MLRLMLDHHPRIAFLGEYEFMVDSLPPTGWPDMNEYASYLSRNRVFNHWKLSADFILDYPDLMRSFLAQGINGKRQPRVVGATIHHHFDRLPRIWPEARYIHILRDPRDVAASVVQMGWAGNLWSGARVWLEAEEAWARLESRIDDAHWIEVRFEDLVKDPRRELTRICHYLDLDFDDNMLEYSNNTTYSPPDPGVAFKWKRSYPTGGAALVDQRVGSLIEHRGYESRSGAAEPPGAIRQYQLQLGDKIGKNLFAVRRYGWGLHLTDVVARKTGLRPIAERCRSAKWVIDEAHLK